MASSRKNCKFFGSMRGCRKGDSCYFSHEHPNSIPLCKNRLNCGYGRSCEFRHATIAHRTNANDPKQNNELRMHAPQSSNKTLLNHIPDAITTIIFDMKLEMECHELSEKLNDAFHEQFEWLVIHDRNRHRTDREIADGLHHRDCEEKISMKYSQTRSSVLNNFAYPFISQFTFISNNYPSVTFSGDKLVMSRDEYDMMAMELEDSTNMNREMMKRMKLQIVSMPYEYIRGRMKVNGDVLISLTFSETSVFKTMEEHLISLGYEYDGEFTEDYSESSDMMSIADWDLFQPDAF